MSPLGDICHKHNILYHSYADDQQNYLSFKPSIAGDKTHCLENQQNGLNEICKWMKVNLLKLNDEEMEFILFETAHQLMAADSINTTIQIGNDIIPSLLSVRNLGFFYDSLLKNTTHINRLTFTLYCTLKTISIIQNKLTTRAT